MTVKIEFLAVAPLTSLQDAGRFGALEFGVAASGPMDRGAYRRAETLLDLAGGSAGSTALEAATGRLEFIVQNGPVWGAFCGGDFGLKINGKIAAWESAHFLPPGALVEIEPGLVGNYALIRFNHDFDVPRIIGSRATNMIAKLGSFKGRMIAKGDVIALSNIHLEQGDDTLTLKMPSEFQFEQGPIRFVWGLHADLFPLNVRQEFLENMFGVSSMLDRMGVRLKDTQNVFGASQILSLVSDPIVPGDIQILGDGTPIVLMRDHQPTGGYPRIATIISADLDRFAQMRPNTELSFVPVGVDRAHKILELGKHT